VLLVIVSALAGLTTVTFIWLELAKNFGNDMGDVALALFGGGLSGLLLGLGVGIYGARKWENRQRLIAIAIALALGSGSCGSFVHIVNTAPVR